VAAGFDTVCRECPAGCGVLARNREGRVVKLEGNPDHPVSQGTLCARGQAALQGLYHPDRFAGPQRREGDALKSVGWDDALKTLGDKLGGVKGKGKALAVVTQLESGSLGALLDKWTQALGGPPARDAGAVRLRGDPQRQQGDLRPRRHPVLRDPGRRGRALLRRRLPGDVAVQRPPRARLRAHAHFRDGKAGTFIHVEPRQSLTASNADEWVRNAPGTEAAVALAILKLMVEGGHAADKRFGEAAAGVDPKKVAADSGVPFETLEHIAKAFGAAKPGLAIGGGGGGQRQPRDGDAGGDQPAQRRRRQRRQDGALRPRLGVRQGHAVRGRGEAGAGDGRRRDRGADPRHGVNPAFTLPGGLKVADAIRKVPFVVSFANLPDETTALAHLVLPDTHWLESWGDYSPMEGVSGCCSRR
jgi:molybdopterin-containing oxidoreductase family iron-sulfur binding subunit